MRDPTVNAKVVPEQVRRRVAVLYGLLGVAERIDEIKTHPAYVRAMRASLTGRLATIGRTPVVLIQMALDQADEVGGQALQDERPDQQWAESLLDEAQALVDPIYVRFFGSRIKTGRTVQDAAKRGGLIGGGRKRNATASRDVRLAKEYQARLSRSGLSPTALQAEIGKKHKPPLKRSAAVAAISRGLKILSGKPGTPNE
jgi:hypothetical protein